MRKIAPLLFLLCILVGCKKEKKTAPETPILTVTIEPLRYFTEKIGGDNFEVVSMVPKGSSPETYDPTPQQMVNLGKSTAYFKIGYIGFEQVWMDKIAKNVPQMKVYDTSQGVELIYEEGHYHGDHFHATGVEPHIWNSPKNAKIIAHNIYKALSELDTGNQAQYRDNYLALCEEIDTTDSIVSSILAEGADKVFMIYHPALSYFARDYGLLQIPIEKDGKEPSAGYLKELIEKSKAHQVRVVFIQPEFTFQNAKIIAQETGTQMISINPLDYDWHKEMVHIAKALHHEQDN